MSSIHSKENKKIRREQRHAKEERKEEKAGAFEFMQKINSILAKIRVSDTGIMETNPDKVVNKNKMVITKVLLPPEGGVYTCFDELEHPIKGFCYGETVETVDEVKKTMMSFLTGFFESMTKSTVKTIIFAILFRKQFELMARRFVVQLDYRMRRVLQKPERYCIMAREFYRVFNKMAIWYPEYEKEINSFRNIWCMTMEYDDAYRYTFQDVLVEFDKDAAREDIVKEIKKILDLTLERDDRGLFIKFTQIRKLLFLVNYDKNIKQMLTRFFLELDLNKLQMDEGDLQHAKFKPGYNWTHEENYQKTNNKVEEEKESTEN